LFWSSRPGWADFCNCLHRRLATSTEQFWYSQRVWKASLRCFILITAVLAAFPNPANCQRPLTGYPAPSRISTVVIDPAHGGSDSGARGSGGAVESEIVLDFARAVRVALEAQGFRALLTREGDQNPSFDDRSVLINGLNDAVFVSLHLSSSGPPSTARAYFLEVFPPAVTEPPAFSSGLLEWDRAQEPYLDLSRRLAELVQIQLGLRFQGSPEIPASAPIRQLRTVAAPSMAIEVSSVQVPLGNLLQMGRPLGEALARALIAFRQMLAVQTPAQEARP
jgi:N-acetylmuramoyl-L-alanine amidase